MTQSSFPFLQIAKAFNTPYEDVCRSAEDYRKGLFTEDDPEIVGYLGQALARACMEEEERRASIVCSIAQINDDQLRHM